MAAPMTYLLDNDGDIIKQFGGCSSIRALKTPGQDRFSGSATNAQWASFRSHLSSKGLAWQNLVGSLFQTMQDPSSGFRVEPTQEYLENEYLTLSSQNVPMIVALDWDRTMSVFEGLLMGTASGFAGLLDILEKQQSVSTHLLALDGFVEFLVGGRQRLQQLQRFFQLWDELDVPIFIVTNNTGCPNNPLLFHEMMTILTNQPVQVFCGASQGFSKKSTLLAQGLAC